MSETYGNTFAYDTLRDGLLVVFPTEAKPMPNGEMPCREYFTQEKIYCMMSDLEIIDPNNDEQKRRMANHVLHNLPKEQTAEFVKRFLIHMLESGHIEEVKDLLKEMS